MQVATPSTTKENFDIGVYGQLTPGRLGAVAEATNYLGMTNIPSLGQGFSFGALTIDGGVQFVGRNGLNGISADFQLGAYTRGVTVNTDPTSKNAVPITGMAINVGPQFRASAELSVGGSASVGDFFNASFEAFGAAKQYMGSNSANGGFVLYPNKSNQIQIKCNLYTLNNERIYVIGNFSHVDTLSSLI